MALLDFLKGGKGTHSEPRELRKPRKRATKAEMLDRRLAKDTKERQLIKSELENIELRAKLDRAKAKYGQQEAPTIADMLGTKALWESLGMKVVPSEAVPHKDGFSGLLVEILNSDAFKGLAPFALQAMLQSQQSQQPQPQVQIAPAPPPQALPATQPEPYQSPAPIAASAPEPTPAPQPTAAQPQGDDEMSIFLNMFLGSKSPKDAAKWIWDNAQQNEAFRPILDDLLHTRPDHLEARIGEYGGANPQYAPIASWLLGRMEWTQKVARALRALANGGDCNDCL